MEEMEGFKNPFGEKSTLVVTNMSADCSPVYEIVQERLADIGGRDAPPARTRLSRRYPVRQRGRAR